MTFVKNGVLPDPITEQTDKYFSKSRQALAFNNLNPVVTYRCFMRVDSAIIYKFVEDYLANALRGKDYTFKRFFNEGDIAPAKRPLFEIRGRALDLMEHETVILQKLGWPSLCCYEAQRIVNAVGEQDINIMDMSARHCPGAESVMMASYAAYVAGFTSCSTDLGGSTFGGSGRGSMPHAFIGAFGSTVEAAVAYARSVPDERVIVLVDYYGQELDDAVACYQALGDKLDSVRIDTHGGRYCQGVTNTESEGDFAALKRLTEGFGVQYAGRYANYAYGKGVTIEAVYTLRDALDKAGAYKVGITVSSGFTPEKVAAFIDCNAPVTTIGTGSFLPTDIRDTYATMDIVAYGDIKKIKVGREWLLP